MKKKMEWWRAWTIEEERSAEVNNMNGQGRNNQT